MAHEVSAKLHTKVVAHKDLEVLVKTSSTGKLGTLLISKGNIEWLPRGNSVNKKRMTWQAFADLIEGQGKTVRVKKAAKKTVKKAAKKAVAARK
ncbi:hypothetical protein FCE95_15835 [Luteimonas gilva]|uniref:Uncharacterized protein n=1 Tax=Luteimonas gilva TaxID=2572684 RepID=A0A4U5JMT5_9GAMM|nr:hypothetical protein [Luteimonas gilva]TKR29598.1 hypothetical protein FCE95_15835 [Luteimonas gilva]